MCVSVWRPMDVWGQVPSGSTRGCQISLLGLQALVSCPGRVGAKLGPVKKQNVLLSTKPSSSLEPLRLCLVLLDSLLISSLGQAGPEFPVEPRMTSNLWSSLLYLLSAGITDECHCNQFVRSWAPPMKPPPQPPISLKSLFFFSCVWLSVRSSNIW